MQNIENTQRVWEVQFGPAEIDSETWNRTGHGSYSTTLRGIKKAANQMQVNGFQIRFSTIISNGPGQFPSHGELEQALFIKNGKNTWQLIRRTEV